MGCPIFFEGFISSRIEIEYFVEVALWMKEQ